MIEIRKSNEITTSLHIAGLKLRLPADDSWTPIPDSIWLDPTDQSIQHLFVLGFIEVRACTQGPYPSWYLASIASNIKIPVELLDLSFDEFDIEVRQMKEFSHNAIWSIIKSGLVQEELSNRGRANYITAMESEL